VESLKTLKSFFASCAEKHNDKLRWNNIRIDRFMCIGFFA